MGVQSMPRNQEECRQIRARLACKPPGTVRLDIRYSHLTSRNKMKMSQDVNVCQKSARMFVIKAGTRTACKQPQNNHHGAKRAVFSFPSVRLQLFLHNGMHTLHTCSQPTFSSPQGHKSWKTIQVAPGNLYRSSPWVRCLTESKLSAMRAAICKSNRILLLQILGSMPARALIIPYPF